MNKIYRNFEVLALVGGLVLPIAPAFAVAQGGAGIVVPVGTKQVTTVDSSTFSVSTQPADFISANSAVLHMDVTAAGITSTVNVWFEMTTDPNNLAQPGSAQTTLYRQPYGIQTLYTNGNNVPVAAIVDNLTPDTTYYFRGHAEIVGGNSDVNGDVLSFTTGSVAPQVAPGSTKISGSGATVGVLPGIKTDPAGLVSTQSAVLYSVVDPNGMEVEVWFEWGNTRNLGTQAGYIKFDKNQANGLPWATMLGDLSQNTTYYFRAVAKNQNGTVYGTTSSFNTGSLTPAPTPINAKTSSGFLDIFRSRPKAPESQVTTQPAGFVTENTAVLYMVLDPNGSNIEAWFDWGPTKRMSNKAGYIKFNKQQANGLPWAAILQDLTPNTTYYFRAAIKSESGKVSYGGTSVFTTAGQKPREASFGEKPKSLGANAAPAGSSMRQNLPSVTTQPAGFVTGNTAVLYSVVNPNGSNVEAWFEWGANDRLGTKAGYIKFDKNQANGLPWAAIIGELTPNITYYFRAVAKNSAGTVYGDVVAFTTSSPTAARQSVFERLSGLFKRIFGRQ